MMRMICFAARTVPEAAVAVLAVVAAGLKLSAASSGSGCSAGLEFLYRQTDWRKYYGWRKFSVYCDFAPHLWRINGQHHLKCATTQCLSKRYPSAFRQAETLFNRDIFCRHHFTIHLFCFLGVRSFFPQRKAHEYPFFSFQVAHDPALF